MFLLGNISCKDFVCGAFDGAMTFAASISFPWDLVQAFGICYHFHAYSLVVHIEESVEQDNDTEFFDSGRRCFLGDKDIHHLYPDFWAIPASIRNVGHGCVKFCYLLVSDTCNIMNKGRSKWAAGSTWLHFLPTVSLGLSRDDFRNGWGGTDSCSHFKMGKKLYRIWVQPGFGNKGTIQYFFGSG
jgi:hypothetical protein